MSTTTKVFQETISVSKSFDVSEGWESTEDAHFKTVSFTRTFLGTSREYPFWPIKLLGQ